MMMKTFIICITVSAVLVQVHSRSILTECQTHVATNADEDAIIRYFSGQDVDKHGVELQILCSTYKHGVLTEDGQINKMKLKAELAEYISDLAKVDEILTKCVLENSDPRTTALDLDKCIWEKSGKYLHQYYLLH